MCLLTTSTIRNFKRVFLATNGLLTDVYQKNPDGLGVMYSDGHKLHTHKVMPVNIQAARQFVESLPEYDHMVAVHWRMRTHGLIDMENCHPYRVNHDTYLAHNGILHTGNAADVEKSDTWHFIKNYLTGLSTDTLHHSGFLEMMGDFISDNRFAIMSADGRLSVVNRKQGVEVEGVWFSNTYAWSPGLLIPGYSPFRFEPYKNYFTPHYANIPSSADYALIEQDEDALLDLLEQNAQETIEHIVDTYRITRFTTDELPKFDEAIVAAWITADTGHLVRMCYKHYENVAQALLYYCDYEKTN